MAVSEQVSIDAATASVLSELESISSLKEEQRTTLKAFLNGKIVFVPLPTDLSESLNHQVQSGQLMDLFSSIFK